MQRHGIENTVQVPLLSGLADHRRRRPVRDYPWSEGQASQCSGTTAVQQARLPSGGFGGRLFA